MRGLFQDRLLKTFANSSSYQLGVKFTANSDQQGFNIVSTWFQLQKLSTSWPRLFS
jgi:hypothetical protein